MVLSTAPELISEPNGLQLIVRSGLREASLILLQHSREFDPNTKRAMLIAVTTMLSQVCCVAAGVADWEEITDRELAPPSALVH